MTKSTVRKALVLLAMGGATFAWSFGGLWNDGLTPACVTNGNLVGFYQTVGDEAINAFEDATATALFGQESDFDNLVVEPTATIFRSAWNNWVANQLPLDVGTGPWVE